jgi:predicted nucleic acid-binding protein
LIAVDTSSLARAFAGEEDPQAHRVRDFISFGSIHLPPVVITEVLSNPLLSGAARTAVLRMPDLGIRDGYWERAGLLRAQARRDGFKAKLADCLIAQSCIDHDIPLITYDRDFRHFVRAGLQLA